MCPSHKHFHGFIFSVDNYLCQSIARILLHKLWFDIQAHAALASNEVEIRKLEEAANLEFERSKTETARNAHIVEELEKEVLFIDIMINIVLIVTKTVLFHHINQYIMYTFSSNRLSHFVINYGAKIVLGEDKPMQAVHKAKI